jgi:hypothetical protein
MPIRFSARAIQSYVFSSIGFEGRLLFLRGDIEPVERLLREALSKLGGAQYENMYIPFLGRLAELLAVDGRPEEALLASAECLERTKATEALWLLPDSLRIHGDVLASLQGADSQPAEAYLRESLDRPRVLQISYVNSAEMKKLQRCWIERSENS